MECLWLNKSNSERLQSLLRKHFPGREIKADIHHYYERRYILMQTQLNEDTSLHYEYINGYVELHFEDKFAEAEFKTFRDKLIERSKTHPDLAWDKWGYLEQGKCRYNKIITRSEDLIEGFSYLIRVFEGAPTLSIKSVAAPTLSIKSVSQLPFENLALPPYQRPYKWTVENVNQLLNDLCTFRDSDSYRLGTLVLHENQIVDGQQRLVTLALLFHVLSGIQGIKLDKEFNEHLDKFNKNITFNDPESQAHVRENLEAIRDRKEDFDSKFADFVQNHCSFVVVQIPDIAGAFQFFDSQNARGKPLEPHDLLKAYHLRAIKHLSGRDLKNIYAWQAQDTEQLRHLFLSLYRVKRWMFGRSARQFTQDDIGTFKGINIDGDSYPCYQPDVLCEAIIHIGLDNQYPFQLSHPCINGSRFFDMIRHYSALYDEIRKSDSFGKESKDTVSGINAAKIINTLNTYPEKYRIGDQYIRQLFDCMLLFYVDKFGYAQIDKAVRKIFCEAYYYRLRKYSIHQATIDNAAVGSELIKVIRDAVRPAEVLNYLPHKLQEKDYANNAEKELKELYKGIIQ